MISRGQLFRTVRTVLVFVVLVVSEALIIIAVAEAFVILVARISSAFVVAEVLVVLVVAEAWATAPGPQVRKKLLPLLSVPE
ncbi:MAG TPA: hypothetical protein DCL72_09020 [Rhizobiales bacterium]|nr:hypothetical protein [Hyphomicrobiales bacterium]